MTRTRSRRLQPTSECAINDDFPAAPLRDQLLFMPGLNCPGSDDSNDDGDNDDAFTIEESESRTSRSSSISDPSSPPSCQEAAEEYEKEGWSDLENLLSDESGPSSKKKRLLLHDNDNENDNDIEGALGSLASSLTAVESYVNEEVSSTEQTPGLESVVEDDMPSPSNEEPLEDSLPSLSTKLTTKDNDSMVKPAKPAPTATTRRFASRKRKRGMPASTKEATAGRADTEVVAEEIRSSSVETQSKKVPARSRARRCKSATPRSSPRGTKVAAMQRIQEIHAPNSSAKQRRSSSLQASERLQCPVCLEMLPPASYFDEEDYEAKILEHIMNCSSDNRSKKNDKGKFPAKPDSVKSSPSRIAPANSKAPRSSATTKRRSPTKASRKPKATTTATTTTKRKKRAASTKKVLPQETPNWKPRIQGTGYTGGERSYEAARSTAVSSSSSVSSSNQTTTYYDKAGQPHVVDSGHFLAQTWWRKGQGHSRRRGATSTASVVVPFSLQQCVFRSPSKTAEDGAKATATVAESLASASAASPANANKPDDAEPTRRTRGSRRLQSKARTDADITLRCPICGKAFTPNWLGSVTEDAMSRHVAKCSQKMFRGGSNFTALLNNRSNLPKLFLGCDEVEKGKRHHSLPKRTPEEKAQRAASNEHRARSTGFLFRTGAQHALLDLMDKGR